MRFNRQKQYELEPLEQVNAEALYYAIDANDVEMIDRCLDIDNPYVLLNQKDERGYTAIMWAAEQGRDVAVRALIAWDADIDEADLLGYTPLLIAVKNGHAAVVKILVEACAYINVVGPENCTPLRMASSMGDVDIVQILLEGGANIQPLKADGKTALHAASGDFALVKVLLNAGIKINHQDVHGRTALFYMLSRGWLADRVIALLLSRGAEPRIVEGGDKSIKHSHPELFTQEKLIAYAKYNKAEMDDNSQQQIYELEIEDHYEAANKADFMREGAKVVSKILQERGAHAANLTAAHRQSWVNMVKNKANS